MTQIGTRNEATRHAWVEQSLQQLPAGWRLLDAGAGEQRYRRFCSHLKYVAQDFAKYDGKGDGRGLHTGVWSQSQLELVCDITAIPEPDSAFDAILCTEVLEHIPSPVLALQEFARLLRPAGQLILTAPFVSFTHFAPYHYCTGFNRYFYEAHLPACGFKIAEISTNGDFFELLAQELRRLPEMAARYANERPHRLDRWAMALLLRLMERCSRVDTGSSEFASCGLHVRAIRQPASKPAAP